MSTPALRNLSLDQNVQRHILGQGFTPLGEEDSGGWTAAWSRLKASCVKRRAAHDRTVGARWASPCLAVVCFCFSRSSGSLSPWRFALQALYSSPEHPERLECLLNKRSGLMEQRHMFFDFLLKIIRADVACAKFKALMKAVWAGYKHNWQRDQDLESWAVFPRRPVHRPNHYASLDEKDHYGLNLMN
jgi:hypothetical protein